MMLALQLKKALADTFAFYLKAQNFHWNIEGSNFPQYHSFLGNLYQEVYGSVDALAELIRTLDEYAPGSLTRFKELTSLEETDIIPDSRTMMSILSTDNSKVRLTLLLAYKTAEDMGEVGIANFLQDRIQAHEKHGWMLRAINK